MPDINAVLAAIDAANALDPFAVMVEGARLPANLIYGQRMSTELAAFAPGASEPLQIAARGQHIERWIIPRSAFPMDRVGYLRWRHELKEHHATKLAEILRALDYPPEIVTRVGEIVRKSGLKRDPEVQVLEDVVCIVFLKHEISGFIEKHRDDRLKLAGIIAKTWGKMSEAGHMAALALPPSPEVVDLLKEGLAAK